MSDQILQQTCGDIDAMTVAVICETCGKVKQSGRPCGYRRSSGGYSFDPAQRSGGSASKPRCFYCGWTDGHPPDCRAVDPNPDDR